MSDVTIGPLERFGVGIVGTDVAHDFAFEIVSRRADAASDQIALNFGEPDFDLIEPRRVSRGVMELSVGMGSEELSHGLGLVRRKVVGDALAARLAAVEMPSRFMGRCFYSP